MAKFVIALFSHHSGAIEMETLTADSKLDALRSFHKRQFVSVPSGITEGEIRNDFADTDTVVEIHGIEN